jgi:hypothetical protein
MSGTRLQASAESEEPAHAFGVAPEHPSGLLSEWLLPIELPESQFLNPMDAVLHEWIAAVMAGTPEALELFNARHPSLGGDGSSLLLVSCAEPEGNAWAGGEGFDLSGAASALVACIEETQDLFSRASGNPIDPAASLAHAQAVNAGWMFGG